MTGRTCVFILTLLLILAIPRTAFADKYDAAITAARQAAMIQSGLQAEIDKAQRALESTARQYATYYGVERPIAYGLIVYQTIRTQSAIIPLTRRLTLRAHLDRAFLEYRF